MARVDGFSFRELRTEVSPQILQSTMSLSYCSFEWCFSIHGSDGVHSSGASYKACND